MIQYIVQVEVHCLQLESAGFNLGEVQDVVDDTQQTVGAAIDLVDVVVLFGAELRFQCQLRHTDNGVHRRANLVRHVGQEFRFGAGGLFCGLLGLE